MTPRDSTRPERITLANVLASVMLAVPLLWVAFRYGTKLGLAQAADSLVDGVTAFTLLYSLRLARQPADANHPRGHQRAEPIGALFAAVMAGVLAVEVFREAVVALSRGAQPRMEWTLAFVFGLKIGVRFAFSWVARRGHRASASPALHALEIDARNDVLVGMVALFGFFAARFGWAGWDAWFAMPIALWIGASGLSLARENLSLLMGEAPPEERQRALKEIVQQERGVLSAHDLTARHDGVFLEVMVHIVLDENLSLRQAHDIAESVERRLMEEEDVLAAMVHVDVENDACATRAVAAEGEALE